MKSIKNLVKGKRLYFVFELITPLILSILFSEFLKPKYDASKYYDIEDSYTIQNSFIFLFFFILFLEWFRRFKIKSVRPVYEKFIYLAVMLFVFILGVWYVNQLDII